MIGLAVGRIVHYVLRSSGEHRPAIVANIPANIGQGLMNAGCCNLVVFLDRDHDQEAKEHGATMSVGSVIHGDNHVLNTWHWPERETQ
jgi:hypothetical protein